MAAPKGDKDPVVEAQNKAVADLDLEPPEYEDTTEREQRVYAEEDGEDEPAPEAKG